MIFIGGEIPVWDMPRPAFAAGEVHSRLLAPSLPRPVADDDIVDRLVQIISVYILRTSSYDKFDQTGRTFLQSQVSWHIKRCVRLDLVLPSFPFKSPSSKKVLGVLPDLAEEILLRRLEDLCRSVEDVYAPGASIKLVSDGIVYGDFLGVADKTAYQYNVELRRIANELQLSHIDFVSVQDLLPSFPGRSYRGPAAQAEAEYLANAPRVREAFLSMDVGAYDADEHMKSDEGAVTTYRGYLRFLKLDLDGSDRFLKSSSANDAAGLAGASQGSGRLSRKAREKQITIIARQMMARRHRFSTLVTRAYPHAIRMSIHPHTNAGPQFALRIFPGVGNAYTPWHNTIVANIDGSISVQHRYSVDPRSHELVHRYGRPYFYRELDPAMKWDQDLEKGKSVEFEGLSPFGLLIRPSACSAAVSWMDVPMEKLRSLATRYSLVILRGFGGASQPEYVEKARQMGEVLPWVFGDVLKVKEDPSIDLNNVLTREAMPMHFDGLFKTKNAEDGSLVSNPPQFQMFQCLEAPSTRTRRDAGGRTLFANTSQIYRQVFQDESTPFASTVKNGSWTVFTPMNKSFGGEPLKLPLSMTNPINGHSVLRWHEKWPQNITQFKPTDVHIEDLGPSESDQLGNYLTELMYDRRFVYEHTWMTGDFLIADNIELMHTRTAFHPCSRELWRIHIN